MTVELVSQQLADIAKSFEISGNIIITESHNDTIKIEKEHISFFSWLIQPISNFVTQTISSIYITIFGNIPVQYNETILYFKKVFGDKRIARIDDRWSLDFKRKMLDPSASFSKDTIAKIFASVNEITLEDLEELLEEVKNPDLDQVRFYNKETTSHLRSYLSKVNTIEELTKSQFERLAKTLAPFSKIEHIFLSNAPVKLKSYETELQEAQSRILICKNLKKISREDPLYALSLAKDLSGRRLPKGLIIPHKDGFMANVGRVKEGGTCKYFLKNFENSNIRFPNIILYRGTNIFEFESVKDCFRERIGCFGASSSKEKTEEYLGPQRNFISSPIERVHAIGMSLGGVHAQLDACNFPGIFCKVTTVCSPGISEQDAQTFNSPVNKNLEIEHFVEQEDVIDEFGDFHLGAGHHDGSVTIYTLLNENSNDRSSCPKYIQQVLYNIFMAGIGSHLYPAIDRKIKFKKISNENPDEQQEIEDRLKHRAPYRDPLWEIWRKNFVAFATSMNFIKTHMQKV